MLCHDSGRNKKLPGDKVYVSQNASFTVCRQLGVVSTSQQTQTVYCLKPVHMSESVKTRSPEAAFGVPVAVLHVWEVLRAAGILYVQALVLPTDKLSQVEFVVLNSLERSPKEKTWFRQQAKLCHTLLSEFMTLFKGAILRLAVSLVTHRSRLYQNFECNHKTVSQAVQTQGLITYHEQHKSMPQHQTFFI